jgi:hypothetical protein
MSAHRRTDLPPLERAVSDTLDEWLSRLHGILSSWASPQEFLDWLRGRGYEVVERSILQDSADAIDTAITGEDGLDGLVGQEVLLRLAQRGVHPKAREWQDGTVRECWPGETAADTAEET